MRVMEPGNIVEFIDRNKIVCAVVLDIKKLRLRLLTENNREVKLSASRLAHRSDQLLDLALGRDRLVDALKTVVDHRRTLIDQIDIKELWDVLNTEQEWIDLPTMTAFCFPNHTTGDHESAVVRAFFSNRLYFKFDRDRFFPNSQARVEALQQQALEAERRARAIEEGAAWLKMVQQIDYPTISNDKSALVEMLQSVYLFRKESPHYRFCDEVLTRAGFKDPEIIFSLLVKLGVWHKDENLDIYRYDIPSTFTASLNQAAAQLTHHNLSATRLDGYRDLTHLPMLTIDGQATLDYDDALSIEDRGDHYLLGVHIADVAHVVHDGEPLDLEARSRASSIYMADRKIPMLPAPLAENLCSLRAGEIRPAISVMMKVSPTGRIVDSEIFPSRINVKRQLSYYEANTIAHDDFEIGMLYTLAQKFRQNRFDQGAVHISLPEINIWLTGDGTPMVSRINRESPGRMLVAEIMIAANWIMARFLADHKIPAVFRSQSPPRERLYRADEGNLFQNWMQRKGLSRFVLGTVPEAHAGLGLDAYVTATSPIRKYYDLVTQRQIRAALGLEAPQNTDAVVAIIQQLNETMAMISRMQIARHRYWLLKHLETQTGQRADAVVLARRRNSYLILLTEYMLECDLPSAGSIDLKPEDLIQITIQNVNARKEMLNVFMS